MLKFYNSKKYLDVFLYVDSLCTKLSLPNFIGQIKFQFNVSPAVDIKFYLNFRRRFLYSMAKVE